MTTDYKSATLKELLRETTITLPRLEFENLSSIKYPIWDTNLTANPRILTFDIETSPLIAYSWGGKWETNLIEIVEDSKILCFSAKWLGGKPFAKGLPDYKGYKEGIVDDTEIVNEIWELLSSADIVVTQNGMSFDLRVANTRFLAHNLRPPAPYKTIDTKREAKRYLRLPSNALDDLGAYFKLGRKKEHEGFSLWKKCMAGDLGAWRRMMSYNRQDVILTEKLYLLIRPFIKNHPNIANFRKRFVCPKCGSNNVHSRGFDRTQVGVYRKIHCLDCGGWGRAFGLVGERTEITNSQ